MAGRGKKRQRTPANPPQELAEVTENPPTGIEVKLVDDNNVHNWNIVLDGPEGTPYAVHLPLSFSVLLAKAMPLELDSSIPLPLHRSS